MHLLTICNRFYFPTNPSQQVLMTVDPKARSLKIHSRFIHALTTSFNLVILRLGDRSPIVLWNSIYDHPWVYSYFFVKVSDSRLYWFNEISRTFDSQLAPIRACSFGKYNGSLRTDTNISVFSRLQSGRLYYQPDIYFHESSFPIWWFFGWLPFPTPIDARFNMGTNT